MTGGGGGIGGIGSCVGRDAVARSVQRDDAAVARFDADGAVASRRQPQRARKDDVSVDVDAAASKEG